MITSGKGGFASPAMMEKFLNDLGREEWEIVQFHTQPDNFLAFTGLARRSTQRDWTLQDAAAAAAKVEADRLRAEFEAKFKAAASTAPAVEEPRSAGFIEEKAAPDDGFRKPVDTSRDDDPEAHDDEKADEWDKLTAAEEDELPTFFEALKPHMRRNQRGPGQSVGVDFLAKKWDQNEEDLKGALVECGFILPADEDSKPEYLEYDGDLYWLNINRRGELWINTKEKPRPVFRAVKATRVELPAEEPKSADRKPEAGDGKPPSTEATAEGAPAETENREAKVENPEPLPAGPALLERIRPHMRRNRRGPGGSGSTTFLARALRTNEAALREAFVALGLSVPAAASDKPAYLELGDELWWLNLDSRGGLWINGREKRQGETAASASAAEGEASAPPASDVPAASEAAPTSVADNATAPAEAPAAAPVEDSAPKPEKSETGAWSLAAVRLLLKETRTGSVAGKVERLAEELGRPPEEFLATLIASGLKVPEKPREKPVFVPLGEEILWLNKNSRGELWLNAKASKFADDDEKPDDEEGGDDKPRRGRRKESE
ncbi:MAG: hypothetical protein JNK23_10155 [Opitutaceae bacterium]|nr:hypothetical protein [Opitutaceae bacterium]